MVFLIRGHYFNWIAFPEFNVCCELASFDDVFWNEEALSLIFKSPNQITSVLNVIEHLKSMFNDDSTYLMVITLFQLENIYFGLKLNVKAFQDSCWNLNYIWKIMMSTNGLNMQD